MDTSVGNNGQHALQHVVVDIKLEIKRIVAVWRITLNLNVATSTRVAKSYRGRNGQVAASHVTRAQERGEEVILVHKYQKKLKRQFAMRALETTGNGRYGVHARLPAGKDDNLVAEVTRAD